MAKDFSPEEKLLNLIKKKPRPAQAPAPGPARTQSADGGHIGPAPQASADTAVAMSPAIFSFDDFSKLSRIRTINAVLFGVLLLIILFFAMDIFLLGPGDSQMIDGVERPVKVDTRQIEQKPFDYYSQSLGSKNVFKAVLREEPRRIAPTVPKEEIVGSLELLGIISGAVPQAIIMDKMQNRRFFIVEGQTQSGILMKSIGDGSVTVEYKGEEFNLSL